MLQEQTFWPELSRRSDEDVAGRAARDGDMHLAVMLVRTVMFATSRMSFPPNPTFQACSSIHAEPPS